MHIAIHLEEGNTMSTEKLLRVGTVAEMLDCSKSTIWMYARQGKLPKAKKLSARISVWKLSDIEDFISKAGL